MNIKRTMDDVKVVLLFPEDCFFNTFSTESSFNLLHVVYGDSEHIKGDLFKKVFSTWLTEFSELVVPKLIFSTLSKVPVSKTNWCVIQWMRFYATKLRKIYIN